MTEEKKNQKKQAADSEFLRGFAAAIGTLASGFDMPSVAVNIMKCNGITLAMLEEAGCEDFDLKIIRKEWKS